MLSAQSKKDFIILHLKLIQFLHMRFGPGLGVRSVQVASQNRNSIEYKEWEATNQSVYMI